jgi:hypothetical protein
MSPRTFARIYGVVFLLVGILGFVPGINQPPPANHGLHVTNPGHGMLLGLFHVNVLHNIVHLLFGVWGLVASRDLGASKLYGKGTCIIYLVLTVAGLIPGLNTMFGLVPIEGNDVWLHALLALVAGYFGFIAPAVQDNAMTTDSTNTAGTSR